MYFPVRLFPVRSLMPAQKIQAVAGIIDIHFHSLAEKLIHQLDIADGVIHTARPAPPGYRLPHSPGAPPSKAPAPYPSHPSPVYWIANSMPGWF